MKWLKDIEFFFFPPCCEVCGRLLNEGEKIMCSYCYLGLPRTNFHLDPDNPVAKLFWGRVNIEKATSWYYFNKGSDYQGLLHKLKYQGFGEMGVYLGKSFASEIRNTAFARADLMIPVPLHSRKQRKRGYNQSQKIALGMQQIFDIPLETHILTRSTFTDTQTRRSRFDRFLNMQDKFNINNHEKIKAKKILLIDDVVTTGSTLEACAQLLLDEGCGSVLVATVAVA